MKAWCLVISLISAAVVHATVHEGTESAVAPPNPYAALAAMQTMRNRNLMSSSSMSKSMSKSEKTEIRPIVQVVMTTKSSSKASSYKAKRIDDIFRRRRPPRRRMGMRGRKRNSDKKMSVKAKSISTRVRPRMPRPPGTPNPICVNRDIECSVNPASSFETDLKITFLNPVDEYPLQFWDDFLGAVPESYGRVAGASCDACRRRIVDLDYTFPAFLTRRNLVEFEVDDRRLQASSVDDYVIIRARIEQTGDCDSAFDTSAEILTDEEVSKYETLCGSFVAKVAGSSTCCCLCDAFGDSKPSGSVSSTDFANDLEDQVGEPVFAVSDVILNQEICPDEGTPLEFVDTLELTIDDFENEEQETAYLENFIRSYNALLEENCFPFRLVELNFTSDGAVSPGRRLRSTRTVRGRSVGRGCGACPRQPNRFFRPSPRRRRLFRATADEMQPSKRPQQTVTASASLFEDEECICVQPEGNEEFLFDQPSQEEFEERFRQTLEEDGGFGEIDFEFEEDDSCIGQCCEDSDCGDSSRYQCIDNQCRLIGCTISTADPNIECCNVGDCATVQFCETTSCVDLGSPRFTLSWFGDDDLDLHVKAPGGIEIFHGQPNDPLTGGVLDQDTIPNPGDVRRWVESVSFPNGPAGSYTFFVNNFAQSGLVDSRWQIEVFQEGNTLILAESGMELPDGGDSPVFTYVHFPPFKAFEDKAELQNALKSYLLDNSPETEVAQTYGHPIGQWVRVVVLDLGHVSFH